MLWFVSINPFWLMDILKILIAILAGYPKNVVLIVIMESKRNLKTLDLSS